MATLILRRLLILKGTKSVYDEVFHNGVNIIRGDNGVGKSTISNSIYYLLGGDFSKWLPEIEKCDFIIGEVEVNEKIFTIRREITRVSMQPMHIYFGELQEAAKNANNWVPYSYRRTSKGESFSQLLFKALDFPEVETQEDEYITFNQALRLIYIDQISPLDELMKDIEFDSPLIRKTIADLLLGIYDNSLFVDQISLKELRKSLASYESELKVLKSVYTSNDRSLDLNEINHQITQAETRLATINDALTNKEVVLNFKTLKKERRLSEYQNAISEESELLTKSLDEIKRIEFDTVDTRELIEELKKQVTAIEESAHVRSILGELEVDFCPSCLTPIMHSEEPNKCKLCKEPLSEEINNSRIFRIQQQLNAQIKESTYLLEQNEVQIAELSEKVKYLRQSIRSKQNELNSVINDRDSDKNSAHEQLLIEKGRLLQQMENLKKDHNAASRYWSIYNAHSRSKAQADVLDQRIKEKEERQRKKYGLAIDRINFYAKELLKGDGQYEIAFANANQISLDFYKNTYAVDGRNNFSASSLVILKNSIRLGIFFASLTLDYMRFPKFIICDNIEDKGMNEKRSKNFQRNVVQLANSETFKKLKFQIIFSTSMIDPSLNISPYVVGDFYTPTNKALKI